MKPVCVPCRRFYRIKKNGYMFIEGMPNGDKLPLPGNAEPERWRPYKLWSGDLWWCPTCGSEIIVGVAAAPQAEHFMPDFNDKVVMLRPTVGDIPQINDC